MSYPGRVFLFEFDHEFSPWSYTIKVYKIRDYDFGVQTGRAVSGYVGLISAMQTHEKASFVPTL